MPEEQEWIGVCIRICSERQCKRGGSEDAAGEYLGHAPRNVTGRHYTYKGDRYIEQIFHNYVEAV